VKGRQLHVMLGLGLAFGGAGALSCDDPTHDNQVAALGPETGGPGALHRRGQPCLICHGGSGPATSAFAIGGTLYAVKGQDAPFQGADVQLTDAKGAVKHATTNEAGNFFISQDDYAPVYPLTVQLTYGSSDPSQFPTMGTHIGRDGSCAGCHFEPRGPDSPGKVYLVVDPADLPGAAPPPDTDGGGP
jgi:hypothetical protein